MNVQKSVLIALAMVACTALGYVIGQHRPSGSMLSELAAAKTTATKLEIENQRLNRAFKGLPVAGQVNGSSSDERPSLTPLEELQLMAKLRQKSWVTAGAALLDWDGRIDSNFIGLFAITPPEQQRMQTLVEETREKVARLELANGKTTYNADGTVVMVVHAFPIEGGRIYDRLMNNITEILGPARSDAFEKLGADNVELHFGRFGLGEHTYVFRYDSTDAKTPYMLDERIEVKLPNVPSGLSSSFRKFGSFEALVDYVGPIASVLPPEYRRSK
jgi:hypothetical protein